MSVAAEQKVRNRFAISLLFYEAYTNFIDGNLPCTEGDGVKLAALFLATEPKRDFARHLEVAISGLGAMHSTFQKSAEIEIMNIFVLSFSIFDRL